MFHTDLEGVCGLSVCKLLKQTKKKPSKFSVIAKVIIPPLGKRVADTTNVILSLHIIL